MGSVKIKVKMAFGNADEVYVTIKTAKESEVCHLGINPFVCGVVNVDFDFGFFGKFIGDVNSPGGITAVVLCNFFSVYKNSCGSNFPCRRRRYCYPPYA